MSVYIQIISGHGLDSVPCVIFVNDSERVLFDCGEGVQRLCFEQKLKPSKIEHIFLTKLSVETISGLPGFVLTMIGAGRKSINFTGPSGLSLLIDSMKYFSCFEDFTIGVNEIDCLLSTVETKSKISIASLPILSSDNGIVGCCYQLITPLVPGKLNMKRVRELNVPVGPLLSKLKNGQAITLADGRTIDPAVDDSLLGETTPRKRVFIVCDFYSLAKSTHFDELPNFLNQIQRISDFAPEWLLSDCIIHCSPLHLVRSPEYCTFINLFPPSANHIFCGIGCNKQNTTPFQSAYIHAMKLNMIDPEIFPDISRSLCHDDEDGWNDFSHNHNYNSNFYQSLPMMRFYLLPVDIRGIQLDAVNTSFKLLEITDQLRQAILEYSDMKKQVLQDSDFFNDDIRVTFLGTGCAAPSKYRNVSGICLDLPCSLDNGRFQRVLLDCGEGSYGQFVRILASRVESREEINSMIQSVSVIWISHPHADHHLGLARLLVERRELFDDWSDDKKVIVVGPRCLLNWIIALESMDHRLIGSYTWVDIDCSAVPVDDITTTEGECYHKRFLTCNDSVVLDNNLASVCMKLGLISLQSIPVIHCPDAYSLVMTSAEYKIVYSGDCRPSNDLIQYGYGASLLIHEATFASDKQDLAVAKRHSTVDEALNVALAMKAQTTILTHFSQRYPKIPEISLEFRSSVSVAFDYMSISLVQLSSYYKLLFDPLSKLYGDDEDENNECEINSMI